MRCVMLNKKETVVMREIYKRSANNNGVCYIRPVDLMAGIPYNIALEKDDIAPILQGLAYDEYFDVEEVVKDGEYTLFIKLLNCSTVLSLTLQMFSFKLISPHKELILFWHFSTKFFSSFLKSLLVGLTSTLIVTGRKFGHFNICWKSDSELNGETLSFER